MSVVVPFEFLKRLRSPITWADVQFGYTNGLIDGRTVIEYACLSVVTHGTDNEDVVSIACARPSDSLSELLSSIARSETEASDSLKHWAMIQAAYIAESDIRDPLTAIEDIYESCDYPAELSLFVRYMPMNGPDLGSVEANEKRMIDALKQFSISIVSATGAANGDAANGDCVKKLGGGGGLE